MVGYRVSNFARFEDDFPFFLGGGSKEKSKSSFSRASYVSFLFSFCLWWTAWLGSVAQRPGGGWGPKNPVAARFHSAFFRWRRLVLKRVGVGVGLTVFFFRYGGHFHRFIGDPAQAKDVRSRRQRPRCSCRGNATTTTTRPALRTRPSSRASSRSGSRTKSTRSTRRPPTPSSVSQDPVHRRRGIPFTLKPSKTR